MTKQASHVFHRDARASYPTAVRGDGVHLFAADGKRYLDACGGAAVSCLGHSHPRVIAAIQEQARLLETELDELKNTNQELSDEKAKVDEEVERLAGELAKRNPPPSVPVVTKPGTPEPGPSLPPPMRNQNLRCGDQRAICGHGFV